MWPHWVVMTPQAGCLVANTRTPFKRGEPPYQVSTRHQSIWLFGRECGNRSSVSMLTCHLSPGRAVQQVNFARHPWKSHGVPTTSWAIRCSFSACHTPLNLPNHEQDQQPCTHSGKQGVPVYCWKQKWHVICGQAFRKTLIFINLAFSFAIQNASFKAEYSGASLQLLLGKKLRCKEHLFPGVQDQPENIVRLSPLFK